MVPLLTRFSLCYDYVSDDDSILPPWSLLKLLQNLRLYHKVATQHSHIKMMASVCYQPLKSSSRKFSLMESKMHHYFVAH